MMVPQQTDNTSSVGCHNPHSPLENCPALQVCHGTSEIKNEILMSSSLIDSKTDNVTKKKKKFKGEKLWKFYKFINEITLICWFCVDLNNDKSTEPK